MSYDRKRSDSPQVIEPEFNGYQLIGDSQFLRFAEQLLKLDRIQKNGIAYRGLCVSGQKVGDLLRRVRENFARVSEKVILMIGTNDLLQGTSYEAMRDDLRSLLKQLRSKGADIIILLTVPPVPRLNASGDHWNRLMKFNEFIIGMHNGKNTLVADVYSKFVIRTELKKPASRRSAPSSSLFVNGCGTAESPSIYHVKEGTIRVSIGDKASRQVYYAGESHEDDDDRPALQRRLPSRSLVLQPSSGRLGSRDQGDDRRGQRRAHSPDPASDDDECRPPSAKRRFSPPSSSRNRSRTSTSAASRPSYSTADDDHNDGYGRTSARLDDVEALKYADTIRFEFFEKFFGRGPREDLIHINFNGLCQVRRLIMDVIDTYF